MTVGIAIQGNEPLLGLSQVPADVWVDTHHLVRRTVLAFDLGTATGPTHRG